MRGTAARTTSLRRPSSVLAGLLLLLLLAPQAPAAPVTRGEHDAYFQGVLDTLLMREYGWASDSFRVRVRDRVATVILYEDVDAHRAALEADPPPVEGLQGLDIAIADGDGVSDIWPLRRRFYSFLGVTPGTIPFPAGDLFQPLLADLKQPQFFLSARRYDIGERTTTAAAVGYGETFGFYRRPGRRTGDGLQLGLSGALFAQFDLETSSKDLINADYTIGFPLTWRNGATSARLRFYHQSSHLGDEYLLNQSSVERVNLSFESWELLLSRDLGRWRVYFGGEYLVHRMPGELAPGIFHGGLEFRGKRRVWGVAHWVGGVDIKSWEQHDWSPDTTVKAGLEFGASRPGQRRLRVMLEGYEGYAPHGQFYDEKMRFLGLGVYFGF